MMVPKRPCREEGVNGTGLPAQESESVVKDDGIVSMDDMATKMETFLRAVVREEIEKVVHRCLQTSSRSPLNQHETSGRRATLLKFDKKLPSTIFTGAKIEAEDGNPINIMLLDANTKNIITYGALSSMNIEILALDGDFIMEDWSRNEFAANIIKERQGRSRLITGELNVSLRNGVGQLGEICFTDNSSWQRSRKFRLGAQPVQKYSCVREATSDAFIVKDHRGEFYKKHFPPMLKDEVWRLDRIAKNGAFHKRLASHGIHCVGDFLQWFIRDPSTLREVFGGRVSNKTWNTIVGHASTCLVDDGKLYSFFEAEERVGILFDSIHRVVGAMFDGSNYQGLDSLSPPQKALVDSIKRKAYNNLNSLILFDPNSILMHTTASQLDFMSSPGSISCMYDGNTNCQFEVSIQQNNHGMQVLSSPTLHQSFESSDNPLMRESNWSASNSLWSIVPQGLFSTEENSEIQAPGTPHVFFTQINPDSKLFMAMGHSCILILN